MSRTPNDSVPITELASYAGGPIEQARCAPFGLKIILSLFLSFFLVSSDVFTSSILAPLGEKVVIGRKLTAFGTMLQATCLVLCYILTAYSIKHGIL